MNNSSTGLPIDNAAFTSSINKLLTMCKVKNFMVTNAQNSDKIVLIPTV